MKHSQKIQIIGGGLSGLSLGYWLSKFNPDLDIEIYEKRKQYTQDKHWGFWHREQLPQHLKPYSDIILQSFQHIQIGKWISAGDWRYSIIRSIDFYTMLQKELQDKIHFNRDFNAVSDGEALILDSRLAATPSDCLIQQFYGWTVKTSNHKFDLDRCILMDFLQAPSTEALAFMYFIPIAEDKALIEPTLFTPTAQNKRWFEQKLDERLKQMQIQNYSIIEEEQGLLPMSTELYKIPKCNYPIGTRAGWMRASSGYSFERTQFFAQNIAKFYAKNKTLPLPTNYPWQIKWMDKVFLKLLGNTMHLAPEIISNWFQKVPSNNILPFMQGEFHLQSTLKLIINSSHKTHFLKNCL